MRADFLKGEILLVDKPVGWTSFDVVNKIRWVLKRKPGLKNLKIGHGGTLDPLASGLMVLGTGRMTKNLETFQGQDKEYFAEIRLGATTPSFDMETAVDGEYPIAHINEELLRKTLLEMEGPQEQIPPLFSAKRIGGKRAYSFARDNKEVELKPVGVVIHHLELCAFDPPLVNVRVLCSKGTYIRTIAHDLGQKLQSGAYLAGLRRTASGQFHIRDARSLDEWVALLQDFEPEISS